jgi:hypothetical protein
MVAVGTVAVPKITAIGPAETVDNIDGSQFTTILSPYLTVKPREIPNMRLVALEDDCVRDVYRARKTVLVALP